MTYPLLRSTHDEPTPHTLLCRGEDRGGQARDSGGRRQAAYTGRRRLVSAASMLAFRPPLRSAYDPVTLDSRPTDTSLAALQGAVLGVVNTRS